jgi:anti-anti-sigma factor
MTEHAQDPLFTGGGELGRAMAAHDWSATPLGPPGTWPVELRSVVRILLTSRFSMWMAWGPELTMFYNDAYRRDTLRTKHPWALGRPAREVWAEIWDDIGPRIASVLETGEATWDEALMLFLERAGYVEETYHTFSYSPLADGSGAVVGMLCVVSEDTERVIGERRLRILSELGDVSAVTAPTTLQACRAAVDVLSRGRADVPFSVVYLLEDGGRRARAVARHGLRDDPRIVGAVDRDTEPDAPLWGVLDTGTPFDVEGLATTHAGAFLPIGIGSGADPDRAVVVPLTGGGGDPVGAVVAGVSPLRALDEEYRRFLDLVGVGIGTAVADARAYQAQRARADELAELDRAKTEFFTGVSHELRTPLTLIAGPAEDALADSAAPLPPAQRERVELIARNSGRLRRLVDALLEFSRLEDGRTAPDRVPVDLAGLTRGVVESFAPAITRAGLALEVECPALPPVSVDPEMWEKIVLNLLSNAVKYTLEGGIRVALHGDGDGVRLTVTDTGIGVPAADRPLLFQRFHRVAGAAGRSHEGSGIGLALVAELAALHGGSTAVDPAPGGGSVFTVTLPADALVSGEEPAATGPTPTARLYRDEALQWSAQDPPPAEPPGGGAGDTAGATVLVAEDNADLRRFLAGLLSPHYRVEVVSDGRTALQRARTQRPDLVLTDVMMPGLDGFALLAALRSHPATATTPVVMLSARAGEEAAIEGLAAGADDYLVKPFSSADLLARVRSNLQLARVRNQESAWRAALIQSLQDGLFVLDADGTVVETNQAFHAITGHGVEGMPYAPPHPWWPTDADDPDDAATVRAVFEQMLADGRGRFVVPINRGVERRRIVIEVSVESVGEGAHRRFVGTARDVTELRRIAERDRLLADTGRLLAHPAPLPELLDELVRTAVPVLGGLVAVLLTGPDGRQAVAAAAHRRNRARAGIVRAMGVVPPLDERLRADFDRGAAFVAPPGTCPVADELARHDRTEPGGSIIVPLLLGPRVLGTLVVCDADRSPDATDLATAEELGRRLTMAIQARRSADRERRLHELTAALAAAGTVAVAARVVARGLVDLTGASSVTALLRRPDGALDEVHRHRPAGADGAAQPDAEHSADLPAVVEAVATSRAQWDGDGEVARAALPLVVGDRVTGVLSVTFPGPRAFDDDEQAYLRSLTGEAALAFERAALADARRDLADTLQHSLLPAALPEHERLHLAARYLPAASGSRTGGDWYDVLELDGGRVAIVVGDVVGQGPAAAAVMGQLRSALSAYLLRAVSPAQALQWLDAWSVRVRGARASTAICVVVDTATGELRWARAGHPPPLVVGVDGTTRYLDGAAGAVLGVRGAPPFSDGHDRLEPGDTVLLYTDGLVERRGELVDAGFDRIAAAAAGGGAPAGLVATVLAAALDDAGPPDDVALVAARLRPAPLVGQRPARPESLALVRREVAGWAWRTGLTEDETDDLQLAVGEAVANAVEHAYAGQEPGAVRYGLTAVTAGVQVEVADDGRWRPPGDPGYRGRGLRVIDGLGDELAVEHDGAPGTRVRFVLPTGAPVPAAVLPVPVAVRGPADELRLSGELDLASVPELRDELLAGAKAATGPVVVDLTGVTYLASAGVSLLVELVDAAPGRVLLRADATGPVGRVLRLTGLDQHLVS